MNGKHRCVQGGAPRLPCLEPPGLSEHALPSQWEKEVTLGCLSSVVAWLPLDAPSISRGGHSAVKSHGQTVSEISDFKATSSHNSGIKGIEICSLQLQGPPGNLLLKWNIPSLWYLFLTSIRFLKKYPVNKPQRLTVSPPKPVTIVMTSEAAPMCGWEALTLQEGARWGVAATQLPPASASPAPQVLACPSPRGPLLEWPRSRARSPCSAFTLCQVWWGPGPGLGRGTLCWCQHPPLVSRAHALQGVRPPKAVELPPSWVSTCICAAGDSPLVLDAVSQFVTSFLGKHGFSKGVHLFLLLFVKRRCPAAVTCGAVLRRSRETGLVSQVGGLQVTS